MDDNFETQFAFNLFWNIEEEKKRTNWVVHKCLTNEMKAVERWLKNLIHLFIEFVQIVFNILNML